MLHSGNPARFRSKGVCLCYTRETSRGFAPKRKLTVLHSGNLARFRPKGEPCEWNLSAAFPSFLAFIDFVFLFFASPFPGVFTCYNCFWFGSRRVSPYFMLKIVSAAPGFDVELQAGDGARTRALLACRRRAAPPAERAGSSLAVRRRSSWRRRCRAWSSAARRRRPS